MRILITGCRGQIGSCLVSQLNTSTNIKMLALDKKELDITNSDQVNAQIEAFRPDVIINAAAHTGVDKAEKEVELSYAINRDGPLYLATAAEKIGAAILHISTDYVFDGTKIGEYFESDMPSPQGVYGQSKLAGEKAVANACHRHIILRTAWVFSQYGTNFVKTMLRLGKNHETLSVVSDQFGGPTYAGDIASALIHIARAIVKNKSKAFGIYHFSGYPHVSWNAFACAIFQEAIKQNILNKIPNINAIATTDYPTPAKRPTNSKLNTNKIQARFGIKPSDWQGALNHLSLYKN